MITNGADIMWHTRVYLCLLSNKGAKRDSHEVCDLHSLKRFRAVRIFILERDRNPRNGVYVCVCVCVYIYRPIYIYIYMCVCVCVCVCFIMWRFETIPGHGFPLRVFMVTVIGCTALGITPLDK
jgi:hypothetical protein